MLALCPKTPTGMSLTLISPRNGYRLARDTMARADIIIRTVDFTSTGSFRWNVASFNYKGQPVREIKREKERVTVPKCQPRQNTSFFTERADLGKDISKVYLYQWFRHQWNMGDAHNWPSLHPCLFYSHVKRWADTRNQRLDYLNDDSEYEPHF